MSKWTEVTIEVDGEGAEAVADVLQRYCHQGVAIEQALPQEIWPDAPLPGGAVVVRGYFPAQDAATRRKIEEGLHYLRALYAAIPQPAFQTVDEEDWAHAWKRNYHPVRIGERIVVCPAWAEVELQPDDVLIELDPGMAFGTGTHPTTQLCLMACEWFVRPAMTVVDVGTGSGILAIAAAKLGALRVLGREIDEVAVKAAQENVLRNGIAEIVTIQRGSIEGLTTSARHFDLGLANITAKVILQLAEQGLQHLIWPGGKFVFSGIIDEQADEVTAALDAIDLELLGQRQMGDWVMLITKRRPPQ